MSPRRVAALSALGIAAAAAFVATTGADLPGLRLLAKPIPVLVLAALVLGHDPDRYSRWIALGLVLGALGDALLELGPATFLAGLVAFLAAHLAYVAAFLRRRPSPLPLRAIPFALFGGAIFSALRPGLGAMELPVAAYTATICLMGWRALAVLGRGGGRDPWFGLVGALAFIASDTLLAFNRFDAPVPGAAYLVIGLYWLGQLGIAASAWDHTRARH